MSETDSENDYASADEDTEDSSSQQNIPESLKLDTTVIKSEKKTEVSVEPSNRDQTRSANPKPDEGSTIEEPEKNTESNDEQKNTEKKPENSRSESSKAEHVIDSQPRRVQLRLEKKIQQKSRTASLESQKSEEIKSPAQVLSSSSSWGFGSWGTSLLSTAAASVSTFTNQVSQGIGTVLDTVESSLGAQPAEELAAALKERREQQECEENALKQKTSFEDDTESVENEDHQEVEGNSSSIGSFNAASSLLTSVTSLTKVIENTGSKVIMGGLDTLELIGKKTIDIITEGDPGLRKKRLAFNEGVNLSQILREAKEKAESDQANMSSEDLEDSVYYSRFFDENQGLVHLEALEMLANQCQQKVQSALMMSGESEEKEMLEQISRICEDLPSAEETPDDEFQDFNAAIDVHIKHLQIPFSLDKIKKVHTSVISYLDQIGEENASDTKEIYRRAISSLAEFTARCVEQFHKFGELILVQVESDFDVLMCATHLTGLTSVLCVEISSFATRYCQHLNTVASETKDDSVSALITNTYLEASNSTTYVQDAFQLLVPVLQSAMLK